jgi:hypothetical protein
MRINRAQPPSGRFRFFQLVTVALVFGLLAAGCLVENTPTAVATAVPATQTPSPAVEATEPCGFQWAYEPLPEITQQLQAQLDQASSGGVSVRAEAFGENCVRADGSVDGFLAMQTDFYLTFDVQDLTDDSLLGDRLAAALPVLLEFPTDQLPGPARGRVSVTFQAGEQRQSLTFTLDRAQTVLDQGLQGAELYQALETVQSAKNFSMRQAGSITCLQIPS